MIRVAIIHISFGRPKLAFNATTEWLRKADYPKEIEYYLAMDDNDESVPKYFKEYIGSMIGYEFGKFMIDIGDSRSGIQAMNRAVKRISPTTELIMVVADDQGCPTHWDTEMLKVLEGVDNFKEPRYIYVSDGFSDMRLDEGPKYAYVNRAFYERVGFLQCPEYQSMYADNDYFECGKILGIIRAPHLVFPHRHHSRGQGEWDDIYWRTNNLEAVYQGQRVFAERKARHFDL